MRLVVWNCCMALHTKLHRLQSLQPDVAIVPECASPNFVWEKAGLAAPDDAQWIKGNSIHKGLGVFAFNGYKLIPHSDHEPAIRLALPLVVSGPSTFHLLAVWSFDYSRLLRVSDPGPLRRALKHYADFLKAAPSIVAGDFNNHTVFDRPGKAANFANALLDFEQLAMFSAYHDTNGIAVGGEPHPTLYWMRRQDQPYHIDYCFLSASWRDKVSTVSVGEFSDWNVDSDHMPLIVDLCGTAMRP